MKQTHRNSGHTYTQYLILLRQSLAVFKQVRGSIKKAYYKKADLLDLYQQQRLKVFRILQRRNYETSFIPAETEV